MLNVEHLYSINLLNVKHIICTEIYPINIIILFKKFKIKTPFGIFFLQFMKGNS